MPKALAEDTDSLKQRNVSAKNKSKPLPISSRLYPLDLATTKREPSSKEHEIKLLICSLRDNYLSYGEAITKKQDQLNIRNSKDYYGKGFFSIPRVSIPEMKKDSPYLCWQKCIRKTNELLDGKNTEAFILELMALEKLLQQQNKQNNSTQSLEELLNGILSGFENDAGFSSLVTIYADDGKNGILSASQFKEILQAGHPIVDFGAGVQHGKFSHRLQFYLLGQYIKKNIAEFFTPVDMLAIKAMVEKEHPEMLNPNKEFPINKIISIFYRLLGKDEFNNSFDWSQFKNDRAVLNFKQNKQNIPNILNAADIWVQLIDRYGYAGYFSVPSTFGILQKLGLFNQLPVIGEPKITPNSHLKTILDVTPQESTYQLRTQ